jgi:hypothetical protein
VLDYAKVRLVCDDTKGAMKALLRAFGFVHRNFRLTMGVWLLNALLFGVASLIYLQVSNSVTAVSMWAIALMIVWQQAYVLFRTAQRFAAWGAAIEVYSAMTPAPRPPIEVSVASDPAPIIQNDAIPDDELEEPAASQATELEGGR